MTTELQQIKPFYSIEDETIRNGNGVLTVGYKIMLPEVYSISTEEYIEIQNTLHSISKALPDRAVINQKLFYGHKKYDSEIEPKDTICVKKNKIFFDEKKIILSSCELYFSFPLTSTTNAKKNSIYNPIDYWLKTYPKPSQEKIDKTFSIINTITTLLKGTPRLDVIKLEDSDLYFAIKKSYNIETGVSLHENVVPEDQLLNELSKKEQKSGSEYFKIFKVPTKMINEKSTINKTKLIDIDNRDIKADRTLPVSILFPVASGLPIPHIVNVVIEKWSNEDVIKEIDNLVTWQSRISGIIPSARRKLVSFRKYTDILDNNNDSACKVAVNILVHSQDKKKLEDYSTILKSTLLQTTGNEGIELNESTLDVFWSNLPGNASTTKDLAYSTFARAINYMPLETYYYNDNNGLICTDIFDNIIQFQLHNLKYTNSFNGWMFGTTGFGKTHLLQGVIDNLLSAQEHVVIINTKDDYKKQVAINKGVYVDTSELEGINPFLCTKEDGLYFPTDDDFMMLQDIIAIPWKETEVLKTEEKALLKECFTKFYKYINTKKIFPDFNKWYEYTFIFEKEIEGDKEYKNNQGYLFIDFPVLRMTVKEFYEGDGYKGANSSMLNNKHDIDIIKEKFVAFDLSSVKNKPTMFNMYLSYCFNISTRKIYYNFAKGLPAVRVYLDECIDSMKGLGGYAIADYFSKNRSLNASVFITTQLIKYFEALPPYVRTAIFGNGMIKLLIGAQSEDTIEYLKQNIPSLSAFHIEQIRTIENDLTKPYREYLAIINDFSKILRNKVSNYTNSVYTTTPSDTKRIKELFNQTGSLEIAIDLFTEEKYN